MKINFEEQFSKLQANEDILKKVDTNNEIKIFFGLSKEGKKRLAFQSSNAIEQIESTKIINVNYYRDSENYWLSFDLEDNKFQNLFYTFCSDMVNSLSDLSDAKNELEYIKNRFYNWKKMFQNVTIKELSEEKEQGIFGELYFLYKYMIPKYGVDTSILSWAGPLKFNKDFSINDTWYEIKTSSVSSTNIKITSLSQLDSENEGFLSVVKVEKMSQEFNGNLSSVYNLIQLIMSQITTIKVQDDFLNKLVEYGLGPDNNFGSRQFDVKNVKLYLVNNKFPRLTKNEITYEEIDNVSYLLNLTGIEKYKVEEL